MQKRRMPTKKQIIKYHFENLKELGKIDCDSTDKMCFCCGLEKQLERAHILPKWQGGSDTVENLHLLCRNCHVESEGFSGDLYWDWFGSKNIYEEFSNNIKRQMKIVNSFMDRIKAENPDITDEEIVENFRKSLQGEKNAN